MLETVTCGSIPRRSHRIAPMPGFVDQRPIPPRAPVGDAPVQYAASQLLTLRSLAPQRLSPAVAARLVESGLATDSNKENSSILANRQ